MIENIGYAIMGFAATYLSLEVAWHFTACSLKDDDGDKKIKACVFKEIKMVLMAPQVTSGRVR
jgi:hypothetical protein